jgi:hypothetical protein
VRILEAVTADGTISQSLLSFGTSVFHAIGIQTLLYYVVFETPGSRPPADLHVVLRKFHLISVKVHIYGIRS